MDSLRQTVAKVALSNMGFIPLVGSILRLWRGPSLNHHALRHHCERKRISAIIRVETTT